MNEQEYDEFINKCCELIPEGFDEDTSQEQVILTYLREMERFASTIARLTSAFH